MLLSIHSPHTTQLIRVTRQMCCARPQLALASPCIRSLTVPGLAGRWSVAAPRVSTRMSRLVRNKENVK